MTSIAIRQKLHNYLEVADEKKIKAIYTMMEQDIEESLVEYTDDMKRELDTRYNNYETGKVKVITATESKKRIEKLLSRKFK